MKFLFAQGNIYDNSSVETSFDGWQILWCRIFIIDIISNSISVNLSFDLSFENNFIASFTWGN